jgi:cytochrome oxidase Cu insertion factor (SCO1/SenC/PrrC family)
MAYLVMTFIMSLLPLALIFGVIGAVVWRYRKAAQATGVEPSESSSFGSTKPSAASPWVEEGAGSPKESRKPPWRNPFVLAFIVGAAFLTVLPLAQRRFLAAPAPLGELGEWRLETHDGRPFGSQNLAGVVWLAQFVPEPCTGECEERLAAHGRLARHLADLPGPVSLVTFLVPHPGSPQSGSHAPTQTGVPWHFLSGGDGLTRLIDEVFRPQFLAATGQDAGTSLAEWAEQPLCALVDQEGKLRGFWRSDEVGRGNAVNAARLLTRHGPRPWEIYFCCSAGADWSECSD